MHFKIVFHQHIQHTHPHRNTGVNINLKPKGEQKWHNKIIKVMCNVQRFSFWFSAYNLMISNKITAIFGYKITENSESDCLYHIIHRLCSKCLSVVKNTHTHACTSSHSIKDAKHKFIQLSAKGKKGNWTTWNENVSVQITQTKRQNENLSGASAEIESINVLLCTMSYICNFRDLLTVNCIQTHLILLRFLVSECRHTLTRWLIGGKIYVAKKSVTIQIIIITINMWKHNDIFAFNVYIFNKKMKFQYGFYVDLLIIIIFPSCILSRVWSDICTLYTMYIVFRLFNRIFGTT